MKNYYYINNFAIMFRVFFFSINPFAFCSLSVDKLVAVKVTS